MQVDEDVLKMMLGSVQLIQPVPLKYGVAPGHGTSFALVTGFGPTYGAPVAILVTLGKGSHL